MHDEEHATKHDARSMAGLLGLSGHELETWSGHELGSILLHQLQTPLDRDLSALTPDAGRTVSELTLSGGDAALLNFGDLVRHPRPPLQLLQLLKEYAKATRADGSLPAEVATVLYHLSVALALSHCGQRITDAPDAKLRAGIDWCLAQSWLDEGTRATLIQSAAAAGLR